MTRRIAENQLYRNFSSEITRNRLEVNKFSNEVSTGIKASNPGDTLKPATIQQFQDSLRRLDGYGKVAASVESKLAFQESTIAQASDLLTRATEIATQGANETLDENERDQLSVEVFELREALVQLANSTYQGDYIWNGTRTDTPPYNPDTYANPATGPESVRYVFDATLLGATTETTVGISDNLEIRTNSRADNVWNNSIAGLERLGRALSGFETLPASPTLPDGTGVAYAFPADYNTQSEAIAGALDDLKNAQENDLQIERVSLGGRLERLQTANSLITIGKDTAQTVISQLQDADIAESASNLTLAETALQGSLTVTSRVLNLSILDFI